jgi:hypothetical protein
LLIEWLRYSPTALPRSRSHRNSCFALTEFLYILMLRE